MNKYNNSIIINYYKIFTNSSNAVRSFFTIISDIIKANVGSDIIDSDIIKNAKFDSNYIGYALRKIHSDVKYKTSKKYIDISESIKDGYSIKYTWGYDITSNKSDDIVITHISLKPITGVVDRYRINISFEYYTNNINDTNIKNTSSVFNDILLNEILKTFNANKLFTENSAKYNTYLINKKFTLIGFDIGNKYIGNSEDDIFRIII